jgi:hypothetical protein
MLPRDRDAAPKVVSGGRLAGDGDPSICAAACGTIGKRPAGEFRHSLWQNCPNAGKPVFPVSQPDFACPRMARVVATQTAIPATNSSNGVLSPRFVRKAANMQPHSQAKRGFRGLRSWPTATRMCPTS